jgi:hypothetical protein
MLLANDVQNFSSPASSIQLSSPIQIGGLMPRHSVKLRKMFQTSGMRMTTVKRAKPGMR